ncbi:hypothetical protein BSKO_09135 [Bryopsis sp. KO-2023]|nr:hypothetical protein BSKO_09135 [Bryopsis sp. KO-2023]
MASRFSEGVEASDVRIGSGNGSEHEALLRGGADLSGVVQKRKENGKASDENPVMNLDQLGLLHSGGDFYPSESSSSDEAMRKASDGGRGSVDAMEEQVGCEAFLSDQSNWGSGTLDTPSVQEFSREKTKEEFEKQNLSYVNLLSVPGPAVVNGPPGNSGFEVSTSPVVLGVISVQQDPQGSEIGTPIPFDMFTIHNNSMNLPLDQEGSQSSSLSESGFPLRRPDSEGLAPGTPHESEPSSDLWRENSSATKLPFVPPEASYPGLLRPSGAVKNWGIMKNVLATSPRYQMEPVEGWGGSEHQAGNHERSGVLPTSTNASMGSVQGDDVSIVEPEDKENMAEAGGGLELRTDGGSLVREPSDVVLSDMGRGRSSMKSPRNYHNPQGAFAEANRLQGYDSVTNAAAETVAVVVQKMLNREGSLYGGAETPDDNEEDGQIPGVWVNDVWGRKDVEELDADIRSALTDEDIDPGEYFKRDYTDFPSAAHYYVNLHERLNDRMDEELIDLMASFTGRLGPTHPLVEAMKEVMAAQQHEPTTRFSSGLLVDVSMNLDEGGVMIVQDEDWIDDRPAVINTDASAAPTIGSKLNTIDTGSSSLATPPPMETMSRDSPENPLQGAVPEMEEDTEPPSASDEEVLTTVPELRQVRGDLRGLSWVVKKPSLKKGKLQQAAAAPSELQTHGELQAQTSRTSLVSHASSRPQPSTPAPEIEFMRDEVRDSHKQLVRRETREGPRDVYSRQQEPESRGWCCCF